MVADVSGSLRATVSIIDADESGVTSSVDLALIFNNGISLYYSEGELSIEVLLQVPAPEE